MASVWRRITSLSVVALSLSMVGAAGDCVPSHLIVSKSPSAVTPVAPVGGFNTVSQCPSFAAYQQTVDPVFQRLCVTCHAPGGSGTSYFALTAGASTDNDIAAANFFVSRNQAVPTDGSVTVDPNNPDSSSPLLLRLNGGASHQLTLDLGGSDYAAIHAWVSQEATQTCVIDTSTGNVTITGTSPPSS